MLNKFFDPSASVLRPELVVPTLTKSSPHELTLPSRAVIVFAAPDESFLCRKIPGRLIKAWQPYHRIYRLGETGTIVTRSGFGGPNTASLVEELCAFGVREFLLWGYCGGIGQDVRIGDVLMAEGAIREEGASYHYLSTDDDTVGNGWDEWREGLPNGFKKGLIWTTDAPYRETVSKIAYYRDRGVAGVEMEVASFYAVCRFLKVKGIAFLVVSDLFAGEGWRGGFFSPDFKKGVKDLGGFILDEFVA